MSGQPVQHERPDYTYTPTGLMAEPWGKTGHRTEVADYVEAGLLRQRKFMDSDSGRDSLMYVWSLDDDTLLGARLYGSPEHAEVVRRLGNPNPYWVTSQAASTAYSRGLIDEDELDRIVREV